jgi:hypothetical protein
VIPSLKYSHQGLFSLSSCLKARSAPGTLMTNPSNSDRHDRERFLTRIPFEDFVSAMLLGPLIQAEGSSYSSCLPIGRLSL